MQQELLNYYPNLSASQIWITGTTQFEPHFDKSILMEKEVFFKKYNLNNNKMYICFSGDDITTSPDDEQSYANAAQETVVHSVSPVAATKGALGYCACSGADQRAAVWDRRSDGGEWNWRWLRGGL